MKRNEDFRNALGQPDEYFRQSVIDTLDQLNMQAEKEKRPLRRYPARLVCTFAALVLAITGLSLSGVHIPGIPTESSVDAIRPTPTVAAQLTADQLSAGQPVIEASFASLIFRKAEKTDSCIRFTVEAQPKHDHSIALSPEYLPDSPCKNVADFYGITPEDPEQPLNRWVLDQGYREALAVGIFSAFPSEQYSGTIPNSYHIEKCLVQADGSSVLTVTGPVTEDDIYNLNWDVIPINLKNTDQSFIPQLAEHGNLRLEIPGDENIRITAMPNSMEQYLSSISFQNLGSEGDRTAIQIEAFPLHKNSLILAPSVNASEDSPDVIGKTPDYEGQTIVQWAQKHGCPELIKISFIQSLLTPADYSNGITVPEITYGGSDYANHREDGSVDFRIYSSDVSSTNIDTLQLTFRIWDTGKEYSRKDEGYEGKPLILYTQFHHDFASSDAVK